MQVEQRPECDLGLGAGRRSYRSAALSLSWVRTGCDLALKGRKTVQQPGLGKLSWSGVPVQPDTFPVGPLLWRLGGHGCLWWGASLQKSTLQPEPQGSVEAVLGFSRLALGFFPSCWCWCPVEPSPQDVCWERPGVRSCCFLFTFRICLMTAFSDGWGGELCGRPVHGHWLSGRCRVSGDIGG